MVADTNAGRQAGRNTRHHLQSQKARSVI